MNSVIIARTRDRPGQYLDAVLPQKRLVAPERRAATDLPNRASGKPLG